MKSRTDKQREAEFMECAARRLVSNALLSDWSKWKKGYEQKGATPAQVVGLAMAAAVFEKLVQLDGLNIFRRKLALYATLGKVLAEKRVRYLPRNSRRLAEKCDAAKTGQPIEQLVRLPRKGNQNARKNRRYKKGKRARLDDGNALTDPIKWQ